MKCRFASFYLLFALFGAAVWAQDGGAPSSSKSSKVRCEGDLSPLPRIHRSGQWLAVEGTDSRLAVVPDSRVKRELWGQLGPEALSEVLNLESLTEFSDEAPSKKKVYGKLRLLFDQGKDAEEVLVAFHRYGPLPEIYLVYKDRADLNEARTRELATHLRDVLIDSYLEEVGLQPRFEAMFRRAGEKSLRQVTANSESWGQLNRDRSAWLVEAFPAQEGQHFLRMRLESNRSLGFQGYDVLLGRVIQALRDRAGLTLHSGEAVFPSDLIVQEIPLERRSVQFRDSPVWGEQVDIYEEFSSGLPHIGFFPHDRTGYPVTFGEFFTRDLDTPSVKRFALELGTSRAELTFRLGGEEELRVFQKFFLGLESFDVRLQVRKQLNPSGQLNQMISGFPRNQGDRFLVVQIESLPSRKSSRPFYRDLAQVMLVLQDAWGMHFLHREHLDDWTPNREEKTVLRATKWFKKSAKGFVRAVQVVRNEEIVSSRKRMTEALFEPLVRSLQEEVDSSNVGRFVRHRNRIASTSRDILVTIWKIRYLARNLYTGVLLESPEARKLYLEAFSDGALGANRLAREARIRSYLDFAESAEHTREWFEDLVYLYNEAMTAQERKLTLGMLGRHPVALSGGAVDVRIEALIEEAALAPENQGEVARFAKELLQERRRLRVVVRGQRSRGETVSLRDTFGFNDSTITPLGDDPFYSWGLARYGLER